MVDVGPFRGWRYDLAQVGDLSDVVCPPYDVIDPALHDRLYRLHPQNAIRLELNRPEPDDTDPAARYERASLCWKHWRLDGVLRHEHEDALYVYHQEFDWEGQRYLRKGFIGRLRLEPFGSGQVFPHEQTLSGPKADRLALFEACRANLSPVFGLYPDAPGPTGTGAVQARLDDACLPLTAVVATDHLGVTHRLWVVTDHSVIDAVRQGLREQPVFIADGHHRYETALRYQQELIARGTLNDPFHPANFVMMHCVSMQDAGLQILPTHRLVSGVPLLSTADWSQALEPLCECEFMGIGPQGARDTWEMITADGGQAVFGFGSGLDGGWLFARLKHPEKMADLAVDHSAAWQGLAVSRLHQLILGDWARNRFPESQPTCTYVHRLEEVTAALVDGTCTLGCLVPAATIAQVETIASGRETMPPKSTYFYPKLLTGMVFHALT